MTLAQPSNKNEFIYCILASFLKKCTGPFIKAGYRNKLTAVRFEPKTLLLLSFGNHVPTFKLPKFNLTSVSSLKLKFYLRNFSKNGPNIFFKFSFGNRLKKH